MDHKRLSRIIGLKEIQKEQIELEVKKEREELEAENQKLNSLIISLQDCMSKFNLDNGLKNVHEMELFHDYFYRLNRQIKDQHKATEKKAEELEEKENMMIEAYKEKKLLEILYKKVYVEEIKDILVREQRESDFIFLSKLNRARK